MHVEVLSQILLLYMQCYNSLSVLFGALTLLEFV